MNQGTTREAAQHCLRRLAAKFDGRYSDLNGANGIQGGKLTNDAYGEETVILWPPTGAVMSVVIPKWGEREYPDFKPTAWQLTVHSAAVKRLFVEA